MVINKRDSATEKSGKKCNTSSAAPSRNTIQQIKILEYLCSVKTHPTAEEVYTAVKKQLPTITLATVYRNLSKLAEAGKILRFETNSEYRFDADTGCHQHCICKRCGKIIDTCLKEVSKCAMGNLKIEGFEPESVCIIFNGICRKCKNK